MRESQIRPCLRHVVSIDENEETVDIRKELDESDKKFVEARCEIHLIAT